MADQQRVGAREGDGLGLLHRAHGQLRVRCNTQQAGTFKSYNSKPQPKKCKIRQIFLPGLKCVPTQRTRVLVFDWPMSAREPAPAALLCGGRRRG